MSKEFTAELPGCIKNTERTWVARGINSEVWRAGGFALKEYTHVIGYAPDVNIDTLLFYGEIMNEAAKLTEKKNSKIKLPFPLGEHLIRVNTYLRIGKCDECGSVEAVMPFVEGGNLMQLPYKLVLDDWQSIFGTLNYEFEKKLGVEGIFISPVNVKKSGQKALTITDLADDVSWVQKRFS